MEPKKQASLTLADYPPGIQRLRQELGEGVDILVVVEELINKGLAYWPNTQTVRPTQTDWTETFRG